MGKSTSMAGFADCNCKFCDWLKSTAACTVQDDVFHVIGSIGRLIEFFTRLWCKSRGYHLICVVFLRATSVDITSLSDPVIAHPSENLEVKNSRILHLAS